MSSFLQTPSTLVSSFACFKANAICSSVNLLVFIACFLFHLMKNHAGNSTFEQDYLLGGLIFIYCIKDTFLSLIFTLHIWSSIFVTFSQKPCLCCLK